MKNVLLFLVAFLCLALAAEAAEPSVVVSIPQIQGRGARSPLEGQSVTTTGVVSLVTNLGFFMQDETGDGDESTSDGIYVHQGLMPWVTPGDRVRVQGGVNEYVPESSALARANPHTELTRVQVDILSSGPSPVPKRIMFPPAAEGDLERVEGMLVELPGLLTVTQNYFLGRYGQLTLAAGGRLMRPLSQFVAGSAEARALAAENARRRIVLDDGSSRQNPDPTPYPGSGGQVRVGDRVQSLLGVIDYGLSGNEGAGLTEYRLHPLTPPLFTRGNPRPELPPAPKGDLRIASFNLQNYFITLDRSGADCGPGASRNDCRGADSAMELQRQRTKIIHALAALSADVVGLLEVENRGNEAVQDLVAGLNDRLGAGTYASVSLPEGGAGSDAIRSAMIYRPARVVPLGASVSDSRPVHNRPLLAQTLVAQGRRFNVIVAHFKSKGRCPSEPGSLDGDLGDGQGCWNARRVAQAQATRTFISAMQRRSGAQDVLLIGDLNAYAREAPVLDLVHNGLVDQIARFDTKPYSYVFDGESGALDHALSNESLWPRIVSAGHWHINADEPVYLDYNLEFRQPACRSCAPDHYQPDPFRSSDHDPLYVDIRLR
ncbi:ExeM/NucH family extracellular endonuclease [Uliginosibacterium aquaticum]|uniref:ExeM/NucH family extracellular endonuclease n=1 Tax=Uliginosibacterium aquaticum TaxID=2731212 RepID=A0ABX2ICY5_9RHOO|nr:ExeM/NucH family extracellular endonuclease [Uliginosibacterium aquaticum]NSL54321.1 ExeM/NucH family extracellular endonuclease [Uliginosibacterium aquaticum]